ncbi:hypothetical protein CR513_34675, partial [Mucuna pruriens]
MVKSKGKGIVLVETEKGMTYIKDVSFVPNLKENLLSIVKVDDLWLQHRRFGHFNSQASKLLYQKNMMRDISCLKGNNEAYEGCHFGKQHRLPFSTHKAWRAKNLLEFIHTNIWGPMRTLSFNNNKYFIFFINEFSRMTWYLEAIATKRTTPMSLTNFVRMKELSNNLRSYILQMTSFRGTITQSWRWPIKCLRVFGSIYYIHGIIRSQRATKSTTYKQRSSPSIEMLSVKNIFIPMQQPQEEDEKVVRDPSMLSLSPQQASSVELTSR